jgi:hypothetical protein
MVNRSDHEIIRADRLARQTKQLSTGDDNLSKRLSGYCLRVEKLRAMLEHLHETRGNDMTRALPNVERWDSRERFGSGRA